MAKINDYCAVWRDMVDDGGIDAAESAGMASGLLHKYPHLPEFERAELAEIATGMCISDVYLALDQIAVNA